MALTKVTGHVVKPDTNIQFHNTKSTGIVTFTHTSNATSTTTGALQVTGGVGIVKDLHVGGNITVGGTLTYDDVTNIDSLGIITARGGIHIGPPNAGVATVYTNGNASFTGIITATSFVGPLTGTASGNPTLTSGADNRVITATGANALTGESKLTFDASTTQLKITRDDDSNSGLYVFHNDGNECARLVQKGTGHEGTLILKDGGTATVLLDGETGSDSYINSGKFGIGTQSPNYKTVIQVSDTTAYSASTISATQFQLAISNSGANGVAGILLATEPSSGNGGHCGIRALSTGNGNSDLTFSTRGSSTSGERLRITSAGLVQIDTPGVTAGNGASAKLQVDSSSQYDGLLLGNAATYGTISRGANNGALVYTANAYPANLGGGEKITHEWWSGNAGGGGPDQLMVLSASGKLGVNEASPDRHLHVKSGSNSNDGAFRIESATGNIMDMGTDGTGHFLNCVNADPFRIKFAGTEKLVISNTGSLEFTGKGTTIPVAGILHHTNNNLYVRGGTSGLILGNQDNTTTVQIFNGYMKFETNDGTEKLRINSSGYLKHTGLRSGNSENKLAILLTPSYNTSEEDVALYIAENESSSNQISFGGGTSSYNAATRIRFLTAGAVNTTTGTERVIINSTGNIGINCGKSSLEAGVDIGTSGLGANSNTPLMIGTEGGQNRFLKVNFFGNQQNFHSLTLRCNDNGIMNQLDISNPFGGAGYGSGIRFTGYNNDIGGKIEMINQTADNAAKMYMRFKSGGDNERLRIDQNGKVIVASGTLHSTRVLARFGIDCHGMDIYDGVGVVANYGMAFYNDPNTNKANGIGFFNDDGQTCGGYIVHQDKGGSNIGDLIFATAVTANTPVERLRIESDGNIKQNLTSPSGTSPFQDSHWYDRDGGNYTLSATDHDSFTATRNGSGGGVYNKLIYKRVKMSKNCDIEFDLSGNTPSGTYRHVGFTLNADGTAGNYDRLVFRSRPASTGSNQIRIDKANNAGYGFNESGSYIPTFFDGNERHILIQLRDRLVNVIVDGEVIISQKTNADFYNSSGWFGFSIYEEDGSVTIRNLEIRNKFIQPHWLVKATGVNVDVSNGSALPFNSVIKSSSDMSNTSHYNNSTYRFTAPISGMYYVFVRAYRNSSTSDEVAFYVNGSVRNRFKPKPNSGDYIFAGSALIQLMKGEYIDVRAHGSGNFDNFYGNSDAQFSTWGGHLID